MAFHRPNSEQQDAPHRRTLRLGSLGRPRENHTTPSKAAPYRDASAEHLPASKCERRGEQKRCRARVAGTAGPRDIWLTTDSTARPYGDSRGNNQHRTATRTVPPTASAIRRIA